MSEPRPTQFCAFCDRKIPKDQGKTPPGYPPQIKLCPNCYESRVDPNAKVPISRHGNNWTN